MYSFGVCCLLAHGLPFTEAGIQHEQKQRDTTRDSVHISFSQTLIYDCCRRSQDLANNLSPLLERSEMLAQFLPPAKSLKEDSGPRKAEYVRGYLEALPSPGIGQSTASLSQVPEFNSKSLGDI